MEEKRAPLDVLHDQMAQTELKVDFRPLEETAMALEEYNKNSGAEDADPNEYLTGFGLFVVVSVVTAVAFLLFLGNSIVATVSHHHYFQFRYSIHTLLFFSNPTKQAIPQITTDFHSISDIGWYGSAYLLAK
jgi:hypothetical protein